MASNGTLQVVEDVESDSDDGPPPLGAAEDDVASDSGRNSPPPLVTDNDSDEEEAGSDDEPPALTSPSSSEDEMQSDPEDDSEIPPLVNSSEDSSNAGDLSDGADDSSDADSVPGLAPGSADEDSYESDQPPVLDDPNDADPGSDDDMPGLDVDDEVSSGSDDYPDNNSDDSSSDEEYPGTSKPFGKGSGIRQGFLGKQKPAKPPSSSSYRYSNQGVGRREDVGGAAAAARRKQERTSTPYTGAGAGVREDLRGPFPFQQQQQQSRPTMTPEQAAAAAYLRQQQQQSAAAATAAAAAAAASQASNNRWQGQAPRTKPKPTRPKAEPAGYQPQPERPPEVYQDAEMRAALEAFQKEREESRKAMNMHREARPDEKPAPVGRCGLNRGLHDRAEECRVDKLRALVEPHQKRMMMKCSAGCVMLWHMACWREFQAGYEAETREADPKQQGINLTQALKPKDKSKPPTVHCVTPGCPGYINFLGSFEGPLGHETFKAMQYQPTKENLDLIKEAMAEDKQAAQAQRTAARAAAQADKAAAALEAWRTRTNWKPGKPRKKRAKPPKPRPQQQQQVSAANGIAEPAVLVQAASVQASAQQAAATANGNAVPDQQQQQQQQEPAAQEAAATAAAAAKPKGIQVKLAVKPINIAKPSAVRESGVTDSAADDVAPGSPSAASVEGGASQSASQSLSRREAAEATADPLQDLGRPSDHVDATYHTSLEDMLGQQQQEEAAAGGRKKKKKGTTLHWDEVRTVLEAQDYERQQQEKRDRLSGIRPPRKHPPLPDPQAQQLQQQQAAAVPSAGDFPTLDAAIRHGDEQLVQTDYLAQGLQDLKISADDMQRTPFVLLECVDFYMMGKRGQNAEEVIKDLVKHKTGGEVIAIRLFEKQEAVAVMTADDVAAQVYVLCHRHQLHRKQLQPSFLRQFPWDDELHRACPQYITPQIREQQEQERREQEQQEKAAQEQLQQQHRQQRQQQQRPAVTVPPEAKQLEAIAKHLTPAELMQRVLEMQKAQALQATEGSGTSSAAAAAAAAGAGSSSTREEPSAAAAAATAAAVGLSRQSSQQRAIPPPMPPPGSPPKQQQQQQQSISGSSSRPSSAPQQPAVGPGVQYMLPHVGPPYVPGMVPTVMGPMYGPVSSMYMQQAAAHAAYGVPVAPQAPYVMSQTWQQQQQGYMGSDSYTWQQQEHGGQYSRADAEGVDSESNAVDHDDADVDDQWHDVAEDGDWEGDGWPEEVVEADETHDAARSTQQTDTSNSAGDAWPAAVVSRGKGSLSGSPVTRLNPMAKEFKVPAGSAGTTPPAAAQSRLLSASSTTAAAGSAPASDAAASSGSSVAEPSEQVAVAATSPAAADGPASSAADELPTGVAASAAAGENSSTNSPTSPAASVATEAGLMEVHQAPSAEPATGSKQRAVGLSVVETRDSSSEHNSSRRVSSDYTAAASNSSANTSTAGSASPSPTFSGSSGTSTATVPASDGPPADHVFDVVILVGTNSEQLRTFYRSPTTPVFGLPHSHLPGSERIITSESAGLISYNVDNCCVEGLWVAIAKQNGVVHWRLVEEYKEVPESVYKPVISLSPFKQRYEGQEALAVTRALWIWKHPTAEEFAPCVFGRPLELPLVTSVSGPHRSLLDVCGCGAEQPGLEGTVVTGSGNGQVTPHAGATLSTSQVATAPRQLPEHIARLAGRPGSAGSGGGVAASKNLRPNRVCPMCKVRESGWLVMGNCKGHMGPCIECVPRPPDMNSGYLLKPVAYPVCLADVDGHACSKPVEKLFKVVST